MSFGFPPGVLLGVSTGVRVLGAMYPLIPLPAESAVRAQTTWNGTGICSRLDEIAFPNVNDLEHSG